MSRYVLALTKTNSSIIGEYNSEDLIERIIVLGPEDNIIWGEKITHEKRNTDIEKLLPSTLEKISSDFNLHSFTEKGVELGLKEIYYENKAEDFLNEDRYTENFTETLV